MKSLLLISLIILAGCNFAQDPLSGQPENIKNGVPPSVGNQKPTPDPLFSDSLMIETSSPQFYFSETIESSFVIQGKTKRDSKESRLILENLNEFPGATYDAASYTLKWTPNKGYTEGEYNKTRELVVTLVAVDKETNRQLSRTEHIPVFVKIKTSEPLVTAVDNLMSPVIIEGTRRFFTVAFKDEDSIVTGEPSLLIQPASGSSYPNASSLIYMSSGKPTRDTVDPTLWKVTLVLDASDVELTQREEQYQFNLVAVSKFGVKSQAFPVNVKFRTSVASPVSSLDDRSTFTLHADVESVFSFVAMDPKGEGKINVVADSLDAIPGTKSFNCLPGSSLSILNCQIKIKPSDIQVEKIYSWKVQIKNKSQVSGDSTFKKLDQSFSFRVIPLPPPPPPPPEEKPEPPPQDTPAPVPPANSGNMDTLTDFESVEG